MQVEEHICLIEAPIAVHHENAGLTGYAFGTEGGKEGGGLGSDHGRLDAHSLALLEVGVRITVLAKARMRNGQITNEALIVARIMRLDWQPLVSEAQPVPDCMLYQQEHMQHSIPSESRYASEELTVGPFILQILSPHTLCCYIW